MPNDRIPGLDYDISGLLGQLWNGVGQRPASAPSPMPPMELGPEPEPELGAPVDAAPNAEPLSPDWSGPEGMAALPEVEPAVAPAAPQASDPEMDAVRDRAEKRMQELFKEDEPTRDMSSLLPPGVMERLQARASQELGIGEIAGLAALAFNSPELAYRLLESKKQEREQADQELLRVGQGNLQLQKQQEHEKAMVRRQLEAERIRREAQEEQGDIAEHRAATREYLDTLQAYGKELGPEGFADLPTTFPRQPGWRDVHQKSLAELQTRYAKAKGEKAKLAFGKLAKGATPAQLDLYAQQYGIDPTDDLYVNLRKEASEREEMKGRIQKQRLQNMIKQGAAVDARLQKLQRELSTPPTNIADARRKQMMYKTEKDALERDAKNLQQLAAQAFADGDVEGAKANYQKSLQALAASQALTEQMDALLPIINGTTPIEGGGGQPGILSNGALNGKGQAAPGVWTEDTPDQVISEALSMIGSGTANTLAQQYAGKLEQGSLTNDDAILRGMILYNQDSSQGINPQDVAIAIVKALRAKGFDPAAIAKNWGAIDDQLTGQMTQQAMEAYNTGPTNWRGRSNFRPIDTPTKQRDAFPNEPPQVP